MNDVTNRVETVVGLSVEDLIDIGAKLQALGIGTSDLLEFLDRDKIQLFAEHVTRIKRLESKLSTITDTACY